MPRRFRMECPNGHCGPARRGQQDLPPRRRWHARGGCGRRRRTARGFGRRCRPPPCGLGSDQGNRVQRAIAPHELRPQFQIPGLERPDFGELRHRNHMGEEEFCALGLRKTQRERKRALGSGRTVERHKKFADNERSASPRADAGTSRIKPGAQSMTLRAVLPRPHSVEPPSPCVANTVKSTLWSRAQRHIFSAGYPSTNSASIRPASSRRCWTSCSRWSRAWWRRMSQSTGSGGPSPVGPGSRTRTSVSVASIAFAIAIAWGITFCAMRRRVYTGHDMAKCRSRAGDSVGIPHLLIFAVKREY